MIDWEAALKLRALLLDFERTMGLIEVSSVEKDILFSFHQIVSDTGTNRVEISQIRSLPELEAVPSATFNRAVKRLVEAGRIALCPGRQRGQLNRAGFAGG